jgi:hypothetical protein
MGYSGKAKKYKPVKGLGKPKDLKEAEAVGRRLWLKYGDQQTKHAEAIEASKSGLTKLAQKLRRKKKKKKEKPNEFVGIHAVSAYERLKQAGFSDEEIKKRLKK